MSRNPGVQGGRPEVFTVRLSVEEAKMVDEARGNLSRSAWLRLMLLEFKKNRQ